ncbi:Aste57867_11010 [Aphanomyces stellatus]|uniref:Aste57867_11010 protein n=1 Tax=Aphanomyces stellatus TaxID=120398 RepID=A0A485KRY2_9STRA|nr:hypothetical protein As57867_010969 [Aphanomyces stellatus]VFT87878.1 Aste57867_11010 [Aphanomyces stellatus]
MPPPPRLPRVLWTIPLGAICTALAISGAYCSLKDDGACPLPKAASMPMLFVGGTLLCPILVCVVMAYCQRVHRRSQMHPVSDLDASVSLLKNEGGATSPSEEAMDTFVYMRACVFLCSSHFLSAWSDRMWQFALPLLLLDIFVDTLFPSALFLFVVYFVCIFVGPFAGRWVDHTDRLVLVRTAILIENLSVVTCALLLLAMLMHVHHRALLFSGVVLCGIFAQVFCDARALAIERDWVIVLAATAAPCAHDNPLTHLNTSLRRIDLTCNILAPVLFGLILDYAGSDHRAAIGAAVVGLWNVLAAPIELCMLRDVYSLVPALRAKHHLGMAKTPPPATCASYVSLWRTYLAHPTWLLSVSFCGLFMTILDDGALIIAYLKWRGVAQSIVGTSLAAGSVSGLLGTLLFPRLLHCFSLELVAVGSVWLFWLSLLPIGVAFIWFPTHSDVVMLVSLSVSRMWLWSTDLADTQIMQLRVQDDVQGSINAMQTAVSKVSFMGILSLSLIFSQPRCPSLRHRDHCMVPSIAQDTNLHMNLMLLRGNREQGVSMRWEDTKRIFPSIPTLKNHTATLVGRRIYVFGGYDGRRNHNDLHIFDCNTLSWETYSEAPHGSGDPRHPDTPPVRRHRYLHDTTFPAGRNGHTATLAKGRIYILGGWLGNGPLAADDLHILDVDALRWEQPETTGSSPGPCNMHTADYVAHIGGIVVFRGGDGKEYLNDLHLLDVDTHHWTTPTTTGTPPMRRANHSSAVLHTHLYLFGGWNGTNRLNDLHILDTTTWQWSAVDVLRGSPMPFPRAGMSFVCVRNRFFLFGGYGLSANTYPAKCFNDLYIFDPAIQSWIEVDATTWRRASVEGGGDDGGGNPNDMHDNDVLAIVGAGPSRRAGHTCTVVHRKLFIFGGSYDNEYLNDMHILDTDPPPEAAVTVPCTFQASLAQYVNSPEHSDISFVVDGRIFYGHKLILSLRSDRFRAMFSAGFREASAAQIEIPDLPYAVFDALMAYVYSGQLVRRATSSSPAALLELLVAADQYMLDHLKQLCELELQHAVDADNVHELFDGAEKANAGQLRAICEHFLRNHDAAAEFA